jgi:hypothetical protein
MFKIVDIITEMNNLLNTTAPVDFDKIVDKLAALNKELAKQIELRG